MFIYLLTTDKLWSMLIVADLQVIVPIASKVSKHFDTTGAISISIYVPWSPQKVRLLCNCHEPLNKKAAVRKVVTYRIRQYVLRCISINLIADACEQFLMGRLWFVWIEFQSDRRSCLVSYRTSCSRQSRLLAPILNEWGYQSTTWKPALNNCYRDIIKNTECTKKTPIIKYVEKIP